MQPFHKGLFGNFEKTFDKTLRNAHKALFIFTSLITRKMIGLLKSVLLNCSSVFLD